MGPEALAISPGDHDEVKATVTVELKPQELLYWTPPNEGGDEDAVRAGYYPEIDLLLAKQPMAAWVSVCGSSDCRYYGFRKCCDAAAWRCVCTLPAEEMTHHRRWSPDRQPPRGSEGILGRAGFAPPFTTVSTSDVAFFDAGLQHGRQLRERQAAAHPPLCHVRRLPRAVDEARLRGERRMPLSARLCLAMQLASLYNATPALNNSRQNCILRPDGCLSCPCCSKLSR